MSIITLFALAALATAPTPRAPAAPVIVYTLRLDSLHLDIAQVEIRFTNVPETFHLAMKVHAEYDAKYWRFLDSLRVDGPGSVTREDSTLWRVSLPAGQGVVRYRVHIQAPTSEPRRAWMPYDRADGAFINSPDFFLYAPELTGMPVTLDVSAPVSWRIATALVGVSARRFSAPDATTFLDSPLMMGRLREWSFVERGTTYNVAYWPLPDAAPFDTLALVDELRRLARAATDVFGRAPVGAFTFLLQDGAGDALEHAASVTLGVPSAALAHDPHARLQEIAHEFVHTWNLVAIRPEGYNALSYGPPRHTSSLWLGEGVTMHYATVLPRRAGLVDTSAGRTAHETDLLEHYYGSPTILSVSPERASLAFGDSPTHNPDATGGYYLQGELIGDALDALVRDSTHDRRGLDDVMRALFDRRTVRDSGYTPTDVVAATHEACGCDPAAFFARQVHGADPIDLAPAFRRLGWRLVIDSMAAVDSAGQPLPDTRVGLDFSAAGIVRFVVSNPATPWAAAGLQTGDEFVSLNGRRVATFTDWRQAIATLRVGERATVEIRRGNAPLRIDVAMAGYRRPRVHLEDAATVTAEQRARRAAWLAGR